MIDIKEKLAGLIYKNSPRLVEEEAASLAKRLIANGVTVQRWIPVTERLPEEDVDVLCFSDSYGGTRFIGYIDYRCKAWIEDGMLHIGNVTHWMPLPKPPKEE